ncbi:pyridoxal 5'-phosphate synthase glutaminase subunit PdxT [Candidatus Atribacteria bacterium MT.SAG.1]|nr:pyridoxal 5'-phosphate synthase glutaminase subunit PdxT [Candidatus Atribacteria bacterium MT.SAG.1]
MKVGVLSLQGAVEEHLRMIEGCDFEGIKVKTIEDLEKVDRLIIPGGESTTIGKLAKIYGLDREIIKKSKEGMPIFGTCAGMILLANKVIGNEQIRFNLIDIVVKRNAFGRQVDSFEADLKIEDFNRRPFKAVFIRAPYIKKAGTEVKVLAEFRGKIVMARQKNILVSSFHPELTDDIRVHKYFLSNNY